jgi:hypothetical protein
MKKLLSVVVIASLVLVGCSESSNNDNEISLGYEVNTETENTAKEPEFATLTPVKIDNMNFANKLGASDNEEQCITECSDNYLALNFIDKQNPTYSVGFFSVEDCPYNSYDYELAQNVASNSAGSKFTTKVINNHTWNIYTYPVNSDAGEATKVLMLRILDDNTYRSIMLFYQKDEESILSKKAESILNQLNI